MKILPLILLPGLLMPVFGDFQVAWEQPIKGISTLDAAHGDIDGDGDIDICLIQLEGEGTVLLNDGSGHFSASSTAAPLPAGGAGKLGDVDGDLDLDLVIASHFGPCKVLLNDGSGNFTDSGQALGGNYSRTSMALVDIDHDLDLDAVFPSNSSDHPSEIWINNQSGSQPGVFTNSGQVIAMAFVQGVTVADVNNDTHPDIALAINGPNKIWLNNGSGIFTESPTALGSGTTFDIAFADLDGDTDLDAYLADGFNPPFEDDNEVWFNDGAGNFSNGGQSLGDNYSFCVVLGDVDGDGDADAVVGNNVTQPNTIWLNNGAGSFSLAPVTLGIGRAIQIVAADLDGDTDTDYFLAVNGFGSEVWKRVPAGQGGPVKDTGQRLGGGSASGVASGDFDGDGDLDVALANVTGITTILSNNGAGQFTATADLANGFGNNCGDVAAGDLDGDNDLDLYIANNQYSGSADLADRVWFNDGTGQFTEGPQLLDAANGSSVELVDIDGDLDLDAIVGISGQDRIYRNDGAGSFTGEDALSATQTSGITVGFLNADSHPDVFVSSYAGPSSVWLNDGSGGFVKTAQDIGTGFTNSAVLADFDGNGSTDIFAANIIGGGKLWTNDGSGSFTQSGQAFGPFSIRSAAAIDLGGDGDMDLWIGKQQGSGVADEVWLNDGSGSFTLDGGFGLRNTSAVVAGDFNDDGDLDIFAASIDGDHVLWAEGTAEVQAYAESFGLAGTDTDPFEDPDGDGVLNYEEMAFNMNPNLADASTINHLATATKGLPTIEIVPDGASYKFIARSIRRAGSAVLDYRLEAASSLVFGSPPAGVTSSDTPLNADYVRTTFEFVVPAGTPVQFGRLNVLYSP
ncbi:FG-GAP repeat domain-containing protein [Luteolibacter marinus]|uniref:FG-GAP repeat domain-containing protein n=1 Tax=Luteolibacter marinus TaxID=2776705 RepID=UPI001867D953|nr:VCBS repeat-containing protein [Luteolibacter marinus]